MSRDTAGLFRSIPHLEAASLNSSFFLCANINGHGFFITEETTGDGNPKERDCFLKHERCIMCFTPSSGLRCISEPNALRDPTHFFFY